MEYKKFDGRISRDFANRAVKIIEQYESINKTDESDYSITLKIVVLSALLAHFVECEDFYTSKTNDFEEFNKLLYSRLKAHITFHRKVSNKTNTKFVARLRHAFNHPGGYPISDSLSATGYTTTPDLNNKIDQIIAIHAPFSRRLNEQSVPETTQVQSENEQTSGQFINYDCQDMYMYMELKLKPSDIQYIIDEVQRFFHDNFSMTKNYH